MSDEDARLISLALSGVEAGFRGLYEAHAAQVKAYMLRCGFQPADADDRAQEVFTRVFKSLKTFDARRGSFAFWLSAIARNVARKYWKQRTEMPNFDPQLAEALFPTDNRTVTAAQENEEMEAVRACVDALPAELGQLVRMRYIEGRTTRGVAAAAGMAESTVRLHLAEASDLIEQCLQRKGILE